MEIIEKNAVQKVAPPEPPKPPSSKSNWHFV